MEKNKKTITALTVMVVLIVALGILSFLQFHRNQEMTQLYEIEKEEMENEYSSFAVQYDELRIQIDNDSLREKLEAEKLKTQRLLEELRQVKSSNAAEILRLKKELKTVRAVMRSYVMQIDSLDRLNKALTQENAEVKSKYNRATAEISSLSAEKKILDQKVTLAKQLDATNILVTPMKKAGKKNESAKNVKLIEVTFTITKNISAETGNKTIYLRILTPNNDVLSDDEATFQYENKEIVYSAKKMIEYTGEQTTESIYVNTAAISLSSGTYGVYLFADGNMIGESSFSLKK